MKWIDEELDAMWLKESYVGGVDLGASDNDFKDHEVMDEMDPNKEVDSDEQRADFVRHSNADYIYPIPIGVYKKN